jgi:endonuclease-3
MNPAKREQIFQRFQRASPDPTTELAYRTPFELLVAVVLSAQATDKSVNLPRHGCSRPLRRLQRC